MSTCTSKSLGSLYAGALIALSLGCAALAACGDDASSSGSGGAQAGSSGSGGSSGAGTSGGAQGGSSGGQAATGGGGQGGGGQGGGEAATGGGGQGSGGQGSGGQGAGSGGTTPDGGSDSGLPDSGFACVAPQPRSEPSIACPSSSPAQLRLVTVRDGLDYPVLVTHAPGDSTRLFVVVRSGQVLIIDPANGQTRSTFLDLTATILAPSSNDSEYGFLGLAFHPNYPTDRRIFVNYTVETSDNQFALDTLVSSFEVSSDPDAIDMSTEQILLRFGQPADNHNGGMLAFGTDNCLYISSGDGGLGESGQSLSTPLAKMLRIDPDNPSARAPGNLASAAYPHIWDYGLRNPWRFSFDRQTGDLYVGDVGASSFEEVNVTPRGVGHHNFGWPMMEGFSCYQPGCDMTGLTLPVADYPHGNGDACVIGGYVYRGSAIPSLAGFYLYADAISGRIRTFAWNGETSCQAPLDLSARDGLSPNGLITSFGEDSAGELYLVTSSTIYRFAAN